MDSVLDRIMSGELFLVKLRNNLHFIQSRMSNDKLWGGLTPVHIFITEILEQADNRNDSKRFQNAKKKEIDGLTWDAVDSRTVPVNAKIIGGRFANALENGGTNCEVAKARYAVQGFNDKMNLFVVHNTPTLRKTSSE